MCRSRSHAVVSFRPWCSLALSDVMSDYESDDEPTVADETVLNKYKLAGEIVHSMSLFFLQLFAFKLSLRSL